MAGGLYGVGGGAYVAGGLYGGDVAILYVVVSGTLYEVVSGGL